MISSKPNLKIAPFIERLDLLKQIMLNETNFSTIYTYFLDNLGDDPEFQKIGKTVKRPKLKIIVTKIGKEVTGTGHITKLILIKTPQYPFIHGPLFIDHCISNLFFFEDINVGLMSILLPSMETHFTRLSYTTEKEIRTATIN